MHVDGKDCLGDNKTEVSVTENVKIDMLLRAPDQWRVTAIVIFCVWDMLGMDMIPGVLVILDYFLVVLVTVLETARRDGQSDTEADTVSTSWSFTETNGVEGVTTLGNVTSDFPDVTSHWTQT